MLGLCVRRLCRSSLFQGSTANSGRLTNTSHCASHTSLARLLEPYIPPTFTALTQIGRTVNTELMEKVSDAGGLRSVLVDHPELFQVSKVGEVYVACRIKQRSGKSDNRRVGMAQKNQRSLARPVLRIESPPEELFHLFPTFFVPVEALVTKLCEAPAAALTSDAGVGHSPESIVRHHIEKHRKFLDVVSLKDSSDGGSEVVECSFVRLRKDLAEASGADEDAEDGEQSISRLMASYEVPDYEQFRVARLLPVVEQFVPISQEMRREALPLLQEGRSLVHVIVSAPELFEIRDTPELSVRFLLDPHYRPVITHTLGEIERQLNEIKEARTRNGMRVPIDRRKRRVLSRQLQFLTKPTPYFDERVLAHALVDVLPPNGPLGMGQAFTLVPPECLRCMPPNVQRFLKEYPHLFCLLEGEKEPLVQRADLPVPEGRPASSIGAEEILLLLYNNYPRRRHPNGGTCLERCVYTLPLPVRTRLRQLDFVEDVLRKHSDKVELLGHFDEELMKRDSMAKDLSKLQVFRFIGVYQEELIKRYEALCVKHGRDPSTTKSLL
ncbi:hypothetical protein DQ04_00211010 [Trypanosoma grayi]|uniref:hypothetical protein n=1 Tax=Trypanosoma grayi TaxID=71804 RepID=UPI0004F45055|nr:hypothetical protein DQ04_00211010 [Trypanosoma grayi]KEG15018.1 hypothetical protein DQ04_00211010 [Trypanosoma grayi]